MTTRHPSNPDSAAADTDHPAAPPVRRQNDDSTSAVAATGPCIRLMCSFGGRILPRPHDNQLRYVGGDTRIVAIPRSSTFSSLLSKLAKLVTPSDDITIKYQLPSEDLDALISVTSDEDVENMMEEYNRLSQSITVTATRPARLRLFLFQPGTGSGSGAFGSILDGSSTSSKHETWFLDALNSRGRLERGRSDASSIMSEVPDYLFGLDSNSVGSPAPQYCSASSALSVPNVPDVPLENPVEPEMNRDNCTEPQVKQQSGYVSNPVWSYASEPVPVYYMPTPVQAGGLPVRPVQMSGPYVHQVQPVVYRQQPVSGQGGPVYMATPPPIGRPAIAAAYDYPMGPMAGAYEVATAGGLVRNNVGMIPMYNPAIRGTTGAGESPRMGGS